MTTIEDEVPEESTWAVRDPEEGELEQLQDDAGETPEHEPGDEDWELDAEEAG